MGTFARRVVPPPGQGRTTRGWRVTRGVVSALVTTGTQGGWGEAESQPRLDTPARVQNKHQANLSFRKQRGGCALLRDAYI